MEFGEQLKRLNSYQREAVLDESRACIVSANVGSGKTTVLIGKIRYLHEVKGVSYSEMAVLTFTNKAADEIRDRLFGNAADPDLSDSESTDSDPTHFRGTADETRLFGTFHSVAMRLLRTMLPAEKPGWNQDFLVIDPEEELDMALRLAAEHKLRIKYKNRLKKRLETAFTEGKDNGAKYQDDFQELAVLLKEEKRKQNKMSFLDLLINAGELLTYETTENTGVKWVIIDELQDIDEIQLRFVDRFMETGANLFAVGDPNQVIYSFRGSKWNIFYSLKERYQARERSLPINYRSSAAILEAAKRFQQSGGALKGAREEGGTVVVKRHYNAFNEAVYLADRIGELHGLGVPYRDIAVFYRLQSQAEILENVFAKNQIPFQVSVKKTIREIPVLNWAVRVLRFSVNGKDLFSGIQALCNQEYGPGLTEKAAGRLVKEYQAAEENQAAGANQTAEENQTAGANEMMKENHTPDGGMLERMSLFLKQGEAIKDAESCWRNFDFDRLLRPNSGNYQEDRRLLAQFLGEIDHYAFDNGMKFAEGMAAYLNSCSLYGIDRMKILRDGIEKQDEAENSTGIGRETGSGAGLGDQNVVGDQNEAGNSGAVSLMTLHASKGLEFSHVFIIGVNNGLIPLRSSEMEEEEEQRLFFVGMTRAKDYLELSYYTNPDSGTFGAVMPGESRYLKRMPRKVFGMEEEGENKTDLQELKRQVMEEKRRSGNGGEEQEKEQGKSDNAASQDPADRKVRHKRYGIGRVTAEDEMMIEVEFDGYGKKEFVKAFEDLEGI